MSVKILEHTADLAFEVTAPTLKMLFQDSFNSLMSLISSMQYTDKKIHTRKLINIYASNKTFLLIDFLNFVLNFAYNQHSFLDRLTILKLSETDIQAEVKGYKTNHFFKEIKAATYHEAEIVQNNNQFRCKITFDI